MRYILLFFIIGFVQACDKPETIIKIYVKENWEHDGILFLTESANVENISDDSLNKYLTNYEKSLALDSIRYFVDKDENEVATLDSNFISIDTVYRRKVIYKNYGKIYSNKEFSIYMIYKTCEEANGRDHQFYLRTYNSKFQIIDSLLFAVWSDDKEIYFSGELTKDLKIKRIYRDSGADFYKISESGKIEVANKH